MLIPKNVFELHRAASDEETRYQLVGVYLKRTGEFTAQAVATNGTVMGVASWNDRDRGDFPGENATRPEATFDAIIPTEACKKLSKHKVMGVARSKPVLGKIALDELKNADNHDALTFTTTDLDSTQRREIKPIDGVYPNYQSVLKSRKETKTFKVDPYRLIQALETLIKTANIKKQDKDVFINVSLGDEGQMIKLSPIVQKEVAVDVYLMPVVIND